MKPSSFDFLSQIRILKRCFTTCNAGNPCCTTSARIVSVGSLAPCRSPSIGRNASGPDAPAWWPLYSARHACVIESPPDRTSFNAHERPCTPGSTLKQRNWRLLASGMHARYRQKLLVTMCPAPHHEGLPGWRLLRRQAELSASGFGFHGPVPGSRTTVRAR